MAEAISTGLLMLAHIEKHLALSDKMLAPSCLVAMKA